MAPATTPLIAILGSINLDITLHVDDLPRPGQTVLAHHATRGLGGKGANQAAAAAQLLGTSRMIGAVGDDPEGLWLLDRLASFGVDISMVRQDDTHPSGVALIGVDKRGENSIMVSPGANSTVTAPSTTTADADALMIQFEIPLDSATQAAEDFRGFVAVNPSPTQPIPAPLIHRADLFVVNADEYHGLPELAQAKLVAVTLGANGAEIRENGRVTHSAPAHTVAHPANTVGAGDAFFAAFVSAIVVGHDPREALSVSTLVAAAAVADAASQPSLGRLEDYVAQVSSGS
ncbi:PfkB family carbohydrate kinase [Pedococcus sp. NPDC057267]|uniref:PfkB family carbohydrate kinase n=1 Tax=Pedococcus sp. NPDC057267 TaxID=3346077 RepID=UPI0036354E8B